MYAQQLRSEIKIKTRSSGYDEAGQPVDTWTTFATVRADIRHLSGTETIKADAITAIVRSSIRIRYLPGVTPGMIVETSASTYAIRAVMPDVNKSRFIDLACETTDGY